MKMKRLVRIQIIVVGIAVSSLFLSGVVHGQAHTNEKFISKDGGFSVKIPGDPKLKSQNVDSQSGPTVLYTFTLEESDGKSFYLVGYSDYPTKLDETKSLEGVISRQVASMKGTITSDKKITLNGHSGRSVTIEDAENVFYSSVYIAGNRLYQVMYGMTKGDKLPEVGRKFLSSFEILI